MITIIKNILTNNQCYISNRKMKKTKGIMIHSTATPGATPENFASAWNTKYPNGGSVCVHGFIDNKKLIQTLPFDMRAWGCGSGVKGSGNDNYIQIEMCEPGEVYFTNGWKYNTKDTDKTKKYVIDTVELLVEFITDKLIELGFNSVTSENVTSHYEAYQAGIASNHGDPKGLLSLAGLNMNDIRAKCAERMKVKLEGTVQTVQTTGTKETGNVQNVQNTDKPKNKETGNVQNVQTIYKNITDVPEYWRPQIQKLIDLNILNGGTDNKINNTDVNLSIDTIKAIVIMMKYIDTINN